MSDEKVKVTAEDWEEAIATVKEVSEVARSVTNGLVSQGFASAISYIEKEARRIAERRGEVGDG